MGEEELLTVYDSHGEKAGTKPRSQVHRDGDWHVVVFVLAARRAEDGRKRFLLQLRSGIDDPYRGQVDVLAAGHVTAAESPMEGALREFREEVGLRLQEEDLADLGNRRLENPSGVCKRAVQQFYLCRRPVLLDQVAFNGEVGGFLEVELDEFAEFMDGRRRRIDAEARVQSQGKVIQRMEVTWEHVAAYSPQILETFRKCLVGVRQYLDTGRLESSLWR